MTTASRRTQVFDRSSLVAYAGVAAAVTFIAAMTFGAIDAPPAERNGWVANAQGPDGTQMVSAAPVADEPTIR